MPTVALVCFFDRCDGFGDELRHAAAVGVAEAEHRRARLLRRQQRLQRVLADWRGTCRRNARRRRRPAGRPRLHQADRVADHLQVFFERDAQHLLSTWNSLVLPTSVTTGVSRLEQRLHARIVLRLHPAPAGHAERGDLRVLQLQLAHVAEERLVLRVGQREAAFDVIDAELVELLRDQQLVLQREVEPFALRAVAEGGVVDFDAALVVLMV